MIARVLQRIVVLCVLAYLAPALPATSPTQVIYVNGIQNKLEDAIDTMVRIETLLVQSVNHSGSSKRSFVVSHIWNPIGWSEKGTKLDLLKEDLMELFLEKTSEELFRDDFKKILAPHNQATSIDKEAAARVAKHLDDMTPGTNTLEQKLLISDVEMAATQTAVHKLIKRIETRKPAVVIAHSQGNLLVNLAWARLVAAYGDAAKGYVRFINVANTSRFAVSGLNFTHAGDAALFSSATGVALPDQSLETLPTRAELYRATPFCQIGLCEFVVATATFGAPTSNIPNQGLADEVLDHSMTETYLSTATVPSAVEQGVSFTPGATRFVDRFEDFVYTAAASLEPCQNGAVLYSGALVSSFAGINAPFELKGCMSQLSHGATYSLDELVKLVPASTSVPQGALACVSGKKISGIPTNIVGLNGYCWPAWGGPCFGDVWSPNIKMQSPSEIMVTISDSGAAEQLQFSIIAQHKFTKNGQQLCQGLSSGFFVSLPIAN